MNESIEFHTKFSTTKIIVILKKKFFSKNESTKLSLQAPFLQTISKQKINECSTLTKVSLLQQKTEKKLKMLNCICNKLPKKITMTKSIYIIKILMKHIKTYD